MSLYRTDDPVRDAENYIADKEAELEKLPKCSDCGYAIQTEKCYEFGSKLICPECLEMYHERNTENYTD